MHELALKYACTFGHSDAVKFLLQRGARDDRGHTLNAAVQFGEARTARPLLQSLPYEPSASSFLESAADLGHADVVEVLLDSGASMDEDSNDVIQMVAENGHKVMLRVFQVRGVDVDKVLVGERQRRCSCFVL
ncbi:hypothetical protein M427DRAFT_61321 [Gonapodya prolifera JEL478]|uniref:Uncharacterized protein n=1 Tax=Gonapodya prolifera (strain JEL478) TaxID=1344416 RepID=A0A139A2J8_GONPJ|nr:hypothetical protein M427DRAFT_61321 [Gonapodya prolifera JEL478]|eukprot:KXS10964.1 hypothetical protein M427DRAFT_61321 [Gonapodya prolifera JEL478]